ncbi:hypothetical protein HZS_7850 [Henneguya salminicola]|nr:hypothetical protein HZS_7850 [Henneguya salminicola]
MSIFQNDVTHFVKKLQQAGKDRRKVIEDSLIGIRREIVSTSVTDTCRAVLKLLNIYIYGQDISWATFSMISLSAHPKLQFKRVGYLGLNLTIHLAKELIPLVINSIMKVLTNFVTLQDLNSMNSHFTIVSMNSLAFFIDEAVAPNVASEISTHITSTNPQIRKRAVILLFLCIKKFHTLVTEYWPRIVSGILDNNSSVRCTTASVVAEFSYDSSFDYNIITDDLISLLQTSSNNWMLIKILKILSRVSLTSKQLRTIETRILVLFQGTSAFSLMFECIRFSCICLHKSTRVIDACAQKLRKYLNHADYNLQYMSICVLRDMITVDREFVVSLRLYWLSYNRNDISALFVSKDLSIRYESIELFSLLAFYIVNHVVSFSIILYGYAENMPSTINMHSIRFLVDPIKIVSDLQRSWVFFLSIAAQAVVLHSLLKIISFIVSTMEYSDVIVLTIKNTLTHFDRYIIDSSLQPLERVFIMIHLEAISYRALLEIILEVQSTGNNDIFISFRQLFTPELRQVSMDAQKKVSVPSCVNLNDWLNKDFQKILEPPNKTQESTESSAKSDKSKPKHKMPTKSKKKENLSRKIVYPEVTYNIAPIDTGEELVTETIQNLNISHETKTVVKPKKCVSKRRREKSDHNTKKTQSDSFLHMTIDSFLLAHNSSAFQSSFHHSVLFDFFMKQNVQYSSIDNIVNELKKNYKLNVIDHSDAALLCVVDSIPNISLLLKLENSCLHVYGKSNSSAIPEELSNSLLDILFRA